MAQLSDDCFAFNGPLLPVAEAERLKLTVNPLNGEEVQKLVAEVSNLPPDLVEKVRNVYVEKGN